MPVNRKGGTWPGGYISLGPDGTPTYFIEKSVFDPVAGKSHRFHISTRTHSIVAAVKHWERFQANPAEYSPVGVASELGGLHLTPELMEAFRQWMLNRERPASEKWVREVAHRMSDWAEDLGSVDLRRVTLRDHIKPALDARGTCRQHRIIALKAFYKWLRVHSSKELVPVAITSAQDPTLDLPVPQAVPEKHTRRKAVPLANVRKVAPKLSPPYRDILVVMADTGMHVTEIERFIRHPDSELVRAKRGDTIGVMVFRHKNRKMHPVAINRPEVLAAAERMKKRGEVPRRMNETLAKACRAAKVPVFTFGVMRHSFATWQGERNVARSKTIKVTGHASEETLKTFYEDVEIPVRGFKTPKI